MQLTALTVQNDRQVNAVNCTNCRVNYEMVSPLSLLLRKTYGCSKNMQLCNFMTSVFKLYTIKMVQINCVLSSNHHNLLTFCLAMCIKLTQFKKTLQRLDTRVMIEAGTQDYGLICNMPSIYYIYFVNTVLISLVKKTILNFTVTVMT